MEDKPIRVPISLASKRGVSWLSETAGERRVILTRFGSPQAVVDSAERVDEGAALLREASSLVVGRYADAAASRTEFRSLEDACGLLGLDYEQVRARAAALRGG